MKKRTDKLDLKVHLTTTTKSKVYKALQPLHTTRGAENTAKAPKARSKVKKAKERLRPKAKEKERQVKTKERPIRLTNTKHTVARPITRENRVAREDRKDREHPMLHTLRLKQDTSILLDEGLLTNTRVKVKEHTDKPEKAKVTTDGIIVTVSYVWSTTILDIVPTEPTADANANISIQSSRLVRRCDVTRT